MQTDRRQLVVKWVQVAEAWLDRLNRTIERGLFFLVYALVLVVTYEVVMRYFFGAPVIWARDVTLWLYSAIFLLPVAHHYACNRQICASDLVYNLRLTASQRATIDLVSNGLLALVTMGLLRPAVNRVMFAIRHNEVSILTLWRPPVWPLLVLIPIMLVLVALRGVLGFIQAASFLGAEEDGAA